MRANSKRDKGTEEWKGGTERQEVRRKKKSNKQNEERSKAKGNEKVGGLLGGAVVIQKKNKKEGQVREESWMEWRERKREGSGRQRER